MNTTTRLDRAREHAKGTRTLVSDSLALDTLPASVRHLLEVVLVDLAQVEEDIATARCHAERHLAALREAQS